MPQAPRIPEPLDFPHNWKAYPNSATALAHAVPHAVVSQVLRPDVAAFLARDGVVMKSKRDAQCCLRELTVAGPVAGLASIAPQFPALVSLNVFCADSDCAEIAELTQLERLVFFNTGPKARLPTPMSNFTALTYLFFRRCKFSSDGMASVTAITQLQELRLIDCRGVDSVSLARLRDLTNLRALDLSECGGVDATVLNEVSKLSVLQKLGLSSCDRVDAEGLAHLSKLPQLVDLDLSRCNGFCAADLSFLSGLPQLTTLNLHQCSAVGAKEDLSHVAFLPHLRHLDVADDPRQRGRRHP